MRAQVAITSIDYGSRQNDRNTSSGGISFRNETYSVDGVGTALGDYVINGPTAQDVYVRRNSAYYGGPSNTTLFYQVDNNNRAYGSSPDSIEELFLDGNLFTGLRDPFANTGSASSSLNSNIERIDFFLGDYVVEEGAGIVLFDLENLGSHGDAFRIAAFDGWNSSTAAPTSYANTGLLVQDGSFGDALQDPTGASSINFNRATYTQGDNLSGNASNYTSLGHDLVTVGILIRFADLGIAAGTTIQGFSLMASDVSASRSSDLVNWNNASVYHTNTNRDIYGNIDLTGFGAQLANTVPEPSTYGAGLSALTLLACGLRKRRQARRPRA